jgi:CRP/FNR family cyclic AMP-dependent transcriptional regulator
VRRQFQDAWQSIAHLGNLQTYDKGQAIYSKGDLTDKVFYLKTGRVKILVVDAEGIERVVSIIEPGNTFGEAAAFDGRPAYVSAVAMVASSAYALDSNELIGAMTQDVALLRVVLSELAHKQRILALQAESATFYSISERVALLLSLLSASYGTNSPDGGGRRVQVGVPLAELASILGMSRVTISREIAKLHKAGVVTKNGRDIIILDLQALDRQMPEGYRETGQEPFLRLP